MRQEEERKIQRKKKLGSTWRVVSSASKWRKKAVASATKKKKVLDSAIEKGANKSETKQEKSINTNIFKSHRFLLPRINILQKGKKVHNEGGCTDGLHSKKAGEGFHCEMVAGEDIVFRLKTVSNRQLSSTCFALCFVARSNGSNHTT